MKHTGTFDNDCVDIDYNDCVDIDYNDCVDIEYFESVEGKLNEYVLFVPRHGG